ncbi:MAG: MFS transporter [Kofleriaceae bacterium]
MKLATARRYTLLGTLYFAQGLPFGFFSIAIPVLLREQGVPLAKIGLVMLLNAPWALKFVWAPYVDRKYIPRIGRRRTWILAMQLAGTVALTTMALVPKLTELMPLLGAMFVLNLIAATQDIATDGLAVELLPPEERGVANGLQVAAYRAGMIIGGGVLPGFNDDIGLQGIFGVMAGLTILSTIPVLVSREPDTITPDAAAPSVHFLKLPGVAPVLALVIIYKFGEAAAQNMLKPFLVDHHLTLGDIAWILGTVGAFAGMAGALVGGYAVEHLGRKRAMVIFGFGQIVTVLGYAYLAFATPSYHELYVWAGVEHFASGSATAALFTAMMDWSRPEASGTDYTVQASAVVISTGIAGMLGGVSAQLLGYGGHFIFTAVLCAGAVIATLALFPMRGFPISAGPESPRHPT